MLAIHRFVDSVDEKFVPLQYIEPIDDMKHFDTEDAQLNLANGTPRFYIMRFVSELTLLHYDCPY